MNVIRPESSARAAAIPTPAFKPNAEIEYLRAVSILFVLVMHAPVLLVPHIPDGLMTLLEWIHPATGVDLFFVVSGYLIGKTFVSPYQAEETSGAPFQRRLALALAFWIRRAWRLFPAAWAWLGFTMAANLLSGNATIWLIHKDMFHKVVASIVMLRNFEESRGPTFFGYMWSLSVENQFYALLPLFLLACQRRRRVAFLCLLLAINAVWRPGGDLWWMFRYDGLIFGLLLAEFARHSAADLLFQALPASRSGRAALCLLCGTTMLVTPKFLTSAVPLAWIVVNAAGALLVFAASRQCGAIVWPTILRRPALWLGARSYAVYLCHVPLWLVIVDVSDRWPALHDQSFLARVATGLVLVGLAAEATYRWIELPCQARGRTRARLFLREHPATPQLSGITP